MAQVAHGPQRDQHHQSLGLFPQIGLPHNGWFMMENIIKIDDLGATFFIETPIWSYICSNDLGDVGYHHFRKPPFRAAVNSINPGLRKPLTVWSWSHLN